LSVVQKLLFRRARGVEDQQDFISRRRFVLSGNFAERGFEGGGSVDLQIFGG